ncbi:hypothetical protein F2Q68_00031893 [Brassica cretica]|uniref:Derlin n=1 Tax=Brassica cretica TaxID=69181 RepID=A0A8S9GGK1_BRACR|nr:hypothetical protein F2Q68_00031893 [Brassica cretica]
MAQAVEEWYKQMPIITRSYLTAAVVTTVGCSLKVYTLPLSLFSVSPSLFVLSEPEKRERRWYLCHYLNIISGRRNLYLRCFGVTYVEYVHNFFHARDCWELSLNFLLHLTRSVLLGEFQKAVTGMEGADVLSSAKMF